MTIFLPKRIIGVALYHEGMTFSMSPPNRHADIIRYLATRGMDIDVTCGAQQGFLTSTGVFVNRTEAKIIAREAKQLLHPTVRANSKELFSEDMW